VTLFEDFVEDFSDLSQWTTLAGTGITVVGGALNMHFPQGVNTVTAEATSNTFQINDSWLSFRFVTPGPSDAGANVSIHAMLYNLSNGHNYDPIRRFKSSSDQR
jgi:hypothetical protein